MRDLSHEDYVELLRCLFLNLPFSRLLKVETGVVKYEHVDHKLTISRHSDIISSDFKDYISMQSYFYTYEMLLQLYYDNIDIVEEYEMSYPEADIYYGF